MRSSSVTSNGGPYLVGRGRPRSGGRGSGTPRSHAVADSILGVRPRSTTPSSGRGRRKVVSIPRGCFPPTVKMMRSKSAQFLLDSLQSSQSRESERALEEALAQIRQGKALASDPASEASMDVSESDPGMDITQPDPEMDIAETKARVTEGRREKSMDVDTSQAAAPSSTAVRVTNRMRDLAKQWQEEDAQKAPKRNPYYREW